MKNIRMIALSNIKKLKGQTISLMILILIASCLLNLGITTYLDCADNFDKKMEESNGEDGILFMQKRGYKEKMYSMVKNSPKVSAYEKEEILLADTTCKYGNGDLAMTIAFVKNKNKNCTIGKSKIVKESKKIYSDGIYVPYIFMTSGGYQLGDSIMIMIGVQKFTYHIQGFFENVYLASINLSIMGIQMNDTIYEELNQSLGKQQGYMIKYQLKDRSDNQSFMSAYYTKCAEMAGDCVYSRAYYSATKAARNMISNIVAVLIIAFSIIIFIVTLIVIRFRITNSIEEDITNIGALKAVGYKKRQIQSIYLYQFLLVTVLGVFFGILLSYALIPMLADVFSTQSGMIWSDWFDLKSILLTIILVLGLVVATVMGSTKKIRHIAPITALRNGIEVHNFKKDHIPLAHTRWNLTCALALKQLFVNQKKNVVISIIILACTFASGFAGILYYNIVSKPDLFTGAVAGEVCDVVLTKKPAGSWDEFLKKLQGDKQVKKAVYYSDDSGVCGDSSIYFNVADDFSSLTSKMCYEGRNPKYDNEVCIGGLMAKEHNKKVGDSIEIKHGSRSYTYVISGLVQSANNMGYDSEMTTKGYQRINPTFKQKRIYVYLKDGVKISAFTKRMKQMYSDQIKDILNLRKLIDTMLGVYGSIIQILGIVIALITGCIVALVLYLITKAQIVSNRTSYGIQKAIGYTTKQIRLQLAMSYVPVLLIGSLLGAIASKVLTNPLISKLFQSFGVMRMEFNIPVAILLFLGILITLFGFMIAMLVSGRIKKISTIQLIRE